MICWPRKQPRLVDPALTLRPWRASDAAAVFAICQDPAIQSFTTIPVPFTREAADAWARGRARSYRRRESITFAGMRNGELVLCLGIDAIREFDHLADIGYWVSPAARGSGLASLAVRMAAGFAFDIGFRRLNAVTLPENSASQKTLLKAGFEREAVLRGAMTRRDGTQSDAVLFARLAPGAAQRSS